MLGTHRGGVGVGVAGFRQREKPMCSESWQYLALPGTWGAGEKAQGQSLTPWHGRATEGGWLGNCTWAAMPLPLTRACLSIPGLYRALLAGLRCQEPWQRRGMQHCRWLSGCRPCTWSSTPGSLSITDWCGPQSAKASAMLAWWPWVCCCQATAAASWLACSVPMRPRPRPPAPPHGLCP